MQCCSIWTGGGECCPVLRLVRRRRLRPLLRTRLSAMRCWRPMPSDCSPKTICKWVICIIYLFLLFILFVLFIYYILSHYLQVSYSECNNKGLLVAVSYYYYFKIFIIFKIFIFIINIYYFLIILSGVARRDCLVSRCNLFNFELLGI